ncbi:DNA-binding NarL/FixJ family response regulator [Geomicrobium halophilum]|uniref:DNA-binding NarL/FixJ family response regulator n=1 Tax=Geomicrobium halophilum TaxID=549000 RepID=A0A841PNL9_9BACL|nr:LuxR C-terminal-related transcriptional regulator [Geomicrobium halophilum]MBB6450370.1 DNA-binding NarL/FixJ family response regulator [Geomicrobium halophilum]
MTSMTRNRTGGSALILNPFLWLQLGGKRNDEFLLTALSSSGYNTEFHEYLPEERPKSRNGVVLLSKNESFRLLESDLLHNLSTYYRVCAVVPEQAPELLKKVVQSEVTTLFSINQSSRKIAQHLSVASMYSTYVDPLLQTELVKALRTYYDMKTDKPYSVDEENEDTLYLDYAKASVRLTASECRVLDAILKGKSNRQIAEDDFLSVSTVNNHVSQLTRKIEANDRTHAVKRVIELDWLHYGYLATEK